MSLTAILLILVVSVGLIVISTSLLKLHPFLSLLITSIFAGFLFGLDFLEILKIVTQGFGNILAYIGIVIVLGSILGELLEKSGAAESIAHAMIRGPGAKNPTLALSFLGAVIGIPVFCDTGFIILSKLAKTIARAKGLSSKRLSVSLAAGLYTTHTLVPPTPGPIAAAGNLGGGDFLGLIMFLGMGISVPVIFLSYLFIRRLSIDDQLVIDEVQDQSFALIPLWRSLVPIVLPILLIGIGTIARLYDFSGDLGQVLLFLGEPIVALLLAILLAFALLKIPEEKGVTQAISQGVQGAGTILIITGAGGSFGAILKASELSQIVEQYAGSANFAGSSLLLAAFALAAILKTAQGSSTSAIVITSSMLAPVLTTFGLQDPLDIGLMVMAVGAGAMTFSHANDSYFWVVSQFGDLQVNEAYGSYSMVTLVQGLSTLAIVFALYLLL